jgi:hypothetical protein
VPWKTWGLPSAPRLPCPFGAAAGIPTDHNDKSNISCNSDQSYISYVEFLIFIW